VVLRGSSMGKPLSRGVSVAIVADVTGCGGN
jgi:hypothetical protein